MIEKEVKFKIKLKPLLNSWIMIGKAVTYKIKQYPN